MSEQLQQEINRMRTFAIISHPDAGKTTLTEKLLLYGGAIHLAGSIKSRKTQRHAVSDWMEIEKQRGISVTSSVLQFDYGGCRINILDTPGHQDFSEDTYRTLMAVDSAVMVLDAAKGVETQTKKLFKVCKERRIPIFTFVNKLDRFGKAPIDLMDELENVLGIRSCPMNWPVGSDGRYRGVYDRQTKLVELFAADETHGQETRTSQKYALDAPELRAALDEETYQALLDDITDYTDWLIWICDLPLEITDVIRYQSGQDVKYIIHYVSDRPEADSGAFCYLHFLVQKRFAQFTNHIELRHLRLPDGRYAVFDDWHI